MTKKCGFFDTIAIVIILDFIQLDFETTIASILKIEDKTIDQI